MWRRGIMAMRIELSTTWRPEKKRINTCHIVEASFVKDPGEQLQANDGVNDNDKQNEKGNVQQGYHGH